MVVAESFQGTAKQCIFDFIWHSRFACPPCKSDQVKIHKSFCDANNVSKVHVTRNEGERCVIGHTPKSWLKQFPDFKTNEFEGFVVHEGNLYATKTSFSMKCNLQSDIMAHPVLNFMAQILGIVFAVMLCCLALTCCKYKKVANQYEEIRQ